MLAWLARQSRLHGKFSALLAVIPKSRYRDPSWPLRFFHVIANLIFSVFNRRAEIPANRASPANRDNPPLSLASSVWDCLVIMGGGQRQRRVLLLVRFHMEQGKERRRAQSRLNYSTSFSKRGLVRRFSHSILIDFSFICKIALNFTNPCET